MATSHFHSSLLSGFHSFVTLPKHRTVFLSSTHSCIVDRDSNQSIAQVSSEKIILRVGGTTGNDNVQHSSLSGIFSSNSFPQSSGIYAEEELEMSHEPEMIADSKEIMSSRQNGTDTHIN